MGAAGSALRLLALVLVFVLAGCATPAAIAPAPASDTPAAVHGWYGRFSATSVVPGNATREERFSGRFLLRRSSGESVIEISSVLGQTIAIARSGPNGARLETADGKVFTAASADELLERVLGWRIPVALLPDWLEGRFGADAGGWQVQVEELIDQLPRRLALRWPEPPRAGQASLALLLIIDGREL